jgi:hypothetical protein
MQNDTLNVLYNTLVLILIYPHIFTYYTFIFT